jgi:hypothetical protein
MTDRELLELAAKAAGDIVDGPIGSVWNPLNDDGDALRLAVKLHLDINAYPCTDEVAATQHKHGKYCEGIINRCFERFASDDPYAATRRAIVRAAAEIGKQK